MEKEDFTSPIDSKASDYDSDEEDGEGGGGEEGENSQTNNEEPVSSHSSKTRYGKKAQRPLDEIKDGISLLRLQCESSISMRIEKPDKPISYSAMLKADRDHNNGGITVPNPAPAIEENERQRTNKKTQSTFDVIMKADANNRETYQNKPSTSTGGVVCKQKKKDNEWTAVTKKKSKPPKPPQAPVEENTSEEAEQQPSRSYQPYKHLPLRINIPKKGRVNHGKCFWSKWEEVSKRVKTRQQIMKAERQARAEANKNNASTSNTGGNNQGNLNDGDQQGVEAEAVASTSQENQRKNQATGNRKTRRLEKFTQKKFGKRK